MSSDKFLFGMLYINLLNLVGFEVEFGDSINFEVLGPEFLVFVFQ